MNDIRERVWAGKVFARFIVPEHYRAENDDVQPIYVNAIPGISAIPKRIFN